MLALSTTPDDPAIVLDFFAGSGSTADAILRTNRADGGKRTFILVQLPEPTLPEPTGRQDYPPIAGIVRERVRRVSSGLAADEADQLDLDAAKDQDRGFRAFKLSESNFTPWNADAGDDAAALARQLELHVEHIREGRTADDLLYEILLKRGYPLSAPVEAVELAGKRVYAVAGGDLLICLERRLTLELVRAMAERQPRPMEVVCLDTGFAADDQLKTNAAQIFKSKQATFKTV